MNTLIDSLQNLDIKIDYNERDILINIIVNNNYDESMINDSVSRYRRYCNGITEWRINGISFEYIKYQMYIFLSLSKKMYKKDIEEMIQSMKYIDSQLCQFIRDE